MHQRRLFGGGVADVKGAGQICHGLFGSAKARGMHPQQGLAPLDPLPQRHHRAEADRRIDKIAFHRTPAA
jgi:hypothetical protein